MRYRFYTTSKSAWKGMINAIASAKKSIYLEMYIFQNDTVGYNFFAVLEKKAREGVRVVLILDSFGSFGVDSRAIDGLRKAGGEVLFFSYWFRRLHRKTLIVDESVVFLGGVNIRGTYAPWKDLQVRVTGRKILSSSLRSFARVYKECGGKSEDIRARLGKKPILRKARTWFTEHGIGGKWLEIREQYEQHIAKAQHSITVVTPYFFPRRWLLARLHEAILRGVRVEIIIPEKTDYGIVNHMNYFQIAFFAKLGAIAYLSHEMNHAKALLIDDTIGMVGSGNLDPISFGWNAEAGVFFTRSAMIRDLRKILEDWKSDADVFVPEMFKPKWYDIFLDLLRRIF
ncbi:MAG: phosphatidylserine/phosphatidylglycerophosphate/cardiolipin synthase family protein [Candidatus Paceibacterota bacterium]|jgi:cardiolipin synthase|nr:phosphatidylserine/phosphatidylglycerophosphate/cardiolipin synthase family protein [Candidatus Paceibacterota bacterium]